jgi:hypothetical protein
LFYAIIVSQKKYLPSVERWLNQRSIMKRFLLALVVAFTALGSSNSEAVTRNFTCHADFNYVGTAFAFSRAWASSCNGVGCDREKKCKEQIESNYLSKGKSFFGNFSPALDAAAQNTVCVAGGANIRVDYGFEADNFPRKKSWNIYKKVDVSGCNCAYTCASGFWQEGDKCVKQACPAGSMPGVPAWLAIGNSGYKTDDKGGTRLFTNATRGNCKF